MLSKRSRAGGIARTGRRAAPPPPLNADAISGEQMVTSSFTWREAEGFSGSSKRAFSVSEAVGVGVEEQWGDNEGTERRIGEGGGRGGGGGDEGSPWRGWTSPGAGKGGECGDRKDVVQGEGEEQEGGGGGGGGARVIEKILLLLERKNVEEEEEEDTCFVWTGEHRKIDRNGEEGVGREGLRKFCCFWSGRMWRRRRRRTLASFGLGSTAR